MVTIADFGSHILLVTNQPRLISFAIDGWTVLGDKVALDLTNRVSVLVGRNGAGKSAILEGLESIASFARGYARRIRPNDYESIPKILNISILTPTNRHLDYSYELISPSISDEDTDIDEDEGDANSSEESLISWNDRCQYADGKQETLWTTELGETTLYFEGDQSDTVVLGNTSSFGRVRKRISSNRKRQLPDEMEWIFKVLRGIRILGKAPVRKTSRRRPSLLRVSSTGIYPGGNRFDLAEILSQKILRRKEAGELGELENICQRIGIGKEIIVQKFFPSESSTRSKNNDEEYVTSVLLDGTNIGLLSDGTLRVLSILIEVMTLSHSATAIIEEPEMQIHPGMLSKLLAEIDTYTFEDNLIISTHSPQVVSWTDPGKINLVYRHNEKTAVRQLGEEEISSVVEYLCEEGTLGDWVYSGLLDD